MSDLFVNHKVSFLITRLKKMISVNLQTIIISTAKITDIPAFLDTIRRFKTCRSKHIQDYSIQTLIVEKLGYKIYSVDLYSQIWNYVNFILFLW